jgi:hypothetical protein
VGLHGHGRRMAARRPGGLRCPQVAPSVDLVRSHARGDHTRST